MQNETIDKLKNAGFITSTADSQGIADMLNISGGSGDFNVYTIDASDPTVWDGDKPTDAVIKEVAMGDYTAIHVINVPIEDNVVFNGYYYSTKSANLDEDNIHYRAFMSFDGGDEEEGESAKVEQLTFLAIINESDPSKDSYQFENSGFELGGGSSELPVATQDTLGGIKVGSGLSCQNDGTLSVSDTPTLDFIADVSEYVNGDPVDDSIYRSITGKILNYGGTYYFPSANFFNITEIDEDFPNWGEWFDVETYVSKSKYDSTAFFPADEVPGFSKNPDYYDIICIISGANIGGEYGSGYLIKNYNNM